MQKGPYTIPTDNMDYCEGEITTETRLFWCASESFDIFFVVGGGVSILLSLDGSYVTSLIQTDHRLSIPLGIYLSFEPSIYPASYVEPPEEEDYTVIHLL